MKKLNFEKLKLSEINKTLRSIKLNKAIAPLNRNEKVKKAISEMSKIVPIIQVMPTIKTRDSRNNYPVLVKEKPKPVKQTQKQNFYDWLVKMGNIYIADRQRMDVALDSIIEY